MTLIAPIMSPPPVHVRRPRRLAVASDVGGLGGSLARSRSRRNLKLTAVAVDGYARFGRALAVNCSLSLMRRVCDPRERGRTRQDGGHDLGAGKKISARIPSETY